MGSLSLLGESASPFIDKWDGLTSERERVRMFLSLAAYDDEYRTTVDAHNTIDVRCMWEVCVIFFGRGRHRRLPYC